MGKQVEPSLRLGSDLNRGAGEPQQGAAGRVQKKKKTQNAPLYVLKTKHISNYCLMILLQLLIIYLLIF